MSTGASFTYGGNDDPSGNNSNDNGCSITAIPNPITLGDSVELSWTRNAPTSRSTFENQRLNNSPITGESTIVTPTASQLITPVATCEGFLCDSGNVGSIDPDALSYVKYEYTGRYRWRDEGDDHMLDISCTTYVQIEDGAGCTDSTANNFNSLVATDDGSCVFDTISATNCVIAENESTCGGQLTWSADPTRINPRVYQDRASQIVASTNNIYSGTNLSSTLEHGNNTFYLRDGATNLASSTAYATCATDTNWNGSICTASGGSGGPTISATNCTISTGTNTCPASLTWNGSSLTSPVVYQTRQGTIFSTNPTGTNQSVVLRHGVNRIWLRDLEVNEVSTNPTASCIDNASLVGGVCPETSPDPCATLLHISTSASLVRYGDEVTITWDTCPSAPADCTLSSNLSAESSDGSEDVTMTSSSLFTLDCPGGETPDAEVEVQVLPRIYES